MYTYYYSVPAIWPPVVGEASSYHSSSLVDLISIP